VKESKPKPRTDKKSKLQVRKFPPELLGRVNAYAELVGINRDEWITKLLAEKTRELEDIQRQLKQKHDFK
jgi:hypothetical protein